ncbi:hypothetical protein WCLP8_540001 [uncultured Gammaproteobacteria bacterium]
MRTRVADIGDQPVNRPAGNLKIGHGETLRQADQDNADTSREILDQASRIAEDCFAARVNLERQFWTENQGIEEAGGKTALEVMTAALDEQNAVMAEELAKRNQTAREQTTELRTTLDDAFKEYLAPAVGMAGDTQANNRALVPTGGAMLNQALEQAGYGPADQTWQETVVRTIVDGLETIGATGERAFATLKESGASALHEIGSEAGVAEQATSSFGTVLEDIGHAASAAVDGLGRLVHDGLQAAEQAFADTGTSAAASGQQLVAATTAAGAGGTAMGREVAEGAETGGQALNEMARLGEDVAIGMAARTGMIGQAVRSLIPRWTRIPTQHGATGGQWRSRHDMGTSAPATRAIATISSKVARNACSRRRRSVAANAGSAAGNPPRTNRPTPVTPPEAA